MHHPMTEQEDPHRNPMQEQIPAESHEEEGSVSSKDEPSEIMDPRAIQGVRRNVSDDGNELYYVPADMWLPSTDVPPELCRAWAKSQRPNPRPSSSSPVSEYEIDDVKRDMAIGTMLHFKGNESENSKWVPVREASPAETYALAKAEKEDVEEEIRDLTKGQESSHLQNRLALLEDLLDGEVVEHTKPHWVSETPSPDSNIPLHKPFYPLPTLSRGYCDNAEHPSSTLSHSTLVAACQSEKHILDSINPYASCHLVCTNCHDNPPIHRLSQDEHDHIIREEGLFPLCLSCAESWRARYGMSPEENGTDCTCKERLPQWLCADCWVEFAKARSRGRDGCKESGCAKTKKDGDQVQGDDAISKAVRMCSGCQGLVIKHADEDDSVDDYSDDDDYDENDRD